MKRINTESRARATGGKPRSRRAERLQVEPLEGRPLLSALNIPLRPLPAPGAETNGTTTTGYGPLFTVYNATDRVFLTGQSITTRTPTGTATRVRYGRTPLGVAGHTIVPFAVLPPTSGTADDPSFLVFDATAGQVQAARQFTFSTPTGPVRRIDYVNVPLGDPGHRNVPVAFLPPTPSPISGVTLGPSLVIYDATSREFFTAQRARSETPAGLTVTVNYGSIAVGGAGENIPVPPLTPRAGFRAGLAATNFGPLYAVYNTTLHTFFTAEAATTTSPTGTTTRIDRTETPLGAAGDTITPIGLVAAPPGYVIGKTGYTFGPTLTVYDATARAYRTAQSERITTVSGNPINPTVVTTNQVNYTDVPLGTAGHEIVPGSVLPGPPTQFYGTTVITFGPSFSIYDATRNTFETAQPFTTTTQGSTFPPRPASSVTQIQYSNVPLGFPGARNIPLAPQPPAPELRFGFSTTGFSPLFFLYDASARTFQSGQNLTTKTVIGTKATISSQVKYDSVVLGD